MLVGGEVELDQQPTGEEQVERLKRSLVRWMDRVCSGTYDEAYYAETANIGHVHVRVGLPQRYMFTAMALIRIAFEAMATGSDVGLVAERLLYTPQGLRLWGLGTVVNVG